MTKIDFLSTAIIFIPAGMYRLIDKFTELPRPAWFNDLFFREFSYQARWHLRTLFREGANLGPHVPRGISTAKTQVRILVRV